MHADSADRSSPRGLSRRSFLELSGAALGASAIAGCAGGGVQSVSASPGPSGSASPDVRFTHLEDRFDPWIEIDAEAFANNVREASRLAGGRPILAVVKNNAYGLGDTVVGPLLSRMPEVGGLACVRGEEAIAMRMSGVTKPIVVLAESSAEEIAELTRHDVIPSVWLDDAPRRVGLAARRVGRPIQVHAFIDTGMNREGMPHTRARPWLEAIANSDSVDLEGTYTMFNHDLEFDREQLARFEALLAWARAGGLALGTLHASPTVELFHLPEAHYDMVRPGNALFGNYPRGEGVRNRADLRPVCRLRTRVVRVEQIGPGESAGFYGTFSPERPTWVALLPVGRTDGYPSSAQGNCEVLIGGRTYPVRGGVNSAHTILDIGAERTVEVGDVATLIGGDHPLVHPHEVADRAGVSHLALLQALNPRLPRRLV